jgi:hypothetical protein
MKKLDRQDPRDVQVSGPAQQAKLEALLFGAMLGTTLLVVGTTVDPKLPPFKGE